MKSSSHPETTPHDTFASLVIACFLALVAWGNALAMLVFSLVATMVWFSLPETRRQSELVEHRGLLALILAAVAAFFIAFLFAGLSSG